MKLRRSARTDVGRTRDHNEDNFGIGEGAQVERLGELLVVCDGMGGHAAGEVASELAVETILASYYADESDDRPAAVRQAFEQANATVYAQGRGSMGTTGVAALLHQGALHIANVGDSRAYLVRGGEIRQLSRDHSFVSDQVDAGLITPEQARTSQHKNIITRALGYQPEVTVDLFPISLQAGDIILLTSDGLHGLVADDELAQIAAHEPPEQAVQRLIELANERGGTDNITVVLAHVDALDESGPPVAGAPPSTSAGGAAPSQGDSRITQEITDRLVPPALAPAAAVAARPPQPRRLSPIGGLLAALLMAVLVFVIVFFSFSPNIAGSPGQQPSAPPLAATSAAATSAATTAPATAPAATRAPAPTRAPATAPAATRAVATSAATAPPATRTAATAPARATAQPTARP